MKRHDSDDSPVAAKLQRFDLSGKALYKNLIIIKGEKGSFKPKIVIYYNIIWF